MDSEIRFEGGVSMRTPKASPLRRLGLARELAEQVEIFADEPSQSVMYSDLYDHCAAACGTSAECCRSGPPTPRADALPDRKRHVEMGDVTSAAPTSWPCIARRRTGVLLNALCPGHPRRPMAPQSCIRSAHFRLGSVKPHHVDVRRDRTASAGPPQGCSCTRRARRSQAEAPPPLAAGARILGRQIASAPPGRDNQRPHRFRPRVNGLCARQFRSSTRRSSVCRCCSPGLDVSISATLAPALWRYETSAVLAREQNRATRHLFPSIVGHNFPARARDLDNYSTTQLAALTSTQSHGLTPAQLNALSTTSLEALNVPGLSTAQAAGLTATTIGNLTTAQAEAFTRTQIGALSATEITALSSTELQAFGTTQLGLVTAVQPGGLAPTTFDNFSTTQLN